jgi:hypothetical protein
MPVIDIHTHCSLRARDDPFGVAQALQGIQVGKNSVTNYRGLPAVSYHDMTDFGLQQEVCAKAGITGRIISNPFAAEVMTAISRKPAIDGVKHVNDQTAAVVAWAKSNWGLGTLNPLDAAARARDGGGVRRRPRHVRHRLRPGAHRSRGAHRHRERTGNLRHR